MLLVTAAFAAYTVDVCATCSFTTIEDALATDAAELLLLDPDTSPYAGFTADREVRISSTAGSRIEGGGFLPTVRVTAAGDLTLAGITVSGGSGGAIDVAGVATLDDVTVEGAGPSVSAVEPCVDVGPGAVVQVLGGLVTGCDGIFGGGLGADAGAVVVLDGTTFQDNAADLGGAVYASGAVVTVTGATFTRNTAVFDGGAISVGLGTVLVVDSSTLTDNAVDAAFGYGGAVNVGSQSVAAVTDSTFASNRAGRGGHVGTIDAASLTIDGGTLDDGAADDEGGAVYVDTWGVGTVVLLTGVTASGNEARAGHGGFLRVVGPGARADVTVTGVVVADGVAGGSGGAISVLGGTLVVADSVFDGVSAGYDGGAIEADGVDAVTITGSAFCGATAGTDSFDAGAGGAVALLQGCDGGCALDGVVIALGSADSGDALAVQAGAATVRHATLVARGAEVLLVTSDGGSIDVDGTVVLEARDVWVSGKGGPVVVRDVVVDPSAGTPSLGDGVEDLGVRLEEVELLVAPLQAGTPEAPPCGVETRIHPQGPQHDAHVEADGSPSDLGAYGGPAPAPGWWDDADADTVGWAYDCDQATGHAATTHGLAPELCDNGRDDDCDGLVDLDDPSAGGDWYLDVDGDGVGAESAGRSCDPPEGAVAAGGDCDDADPARAPDQSERCDGVDNDCDGAVDDGIEGMTWLVDLDGDGFGGAETSGCVPPSSDLIPGDCDDGDAAIHPGAVEIDADGVDQDCDGADAAAFVAGGACGCGGTTGGGLPAVLAIVLLRRSRRSSSPDGPRRSRRGVP